MERPSCKTCPYFESAIEADGDFGICHRHAPRTYLLDSVRNTDYAEYNPAYWPNVIDKHWCGEHPRFPDYIRSLGAMPPVDDPGDDRINFGDGTGWSLRERRALNNLGIATWGQLAEITAEQLMAQRDFGVTSIHDLLDKVHTRGLRLKDERWEPKTYPPRRKTKEIAPP